MFKFLHSQHIIIIYYYYYYYYLLLLLLLLLLLYNYTEEESEQEECAKWVCVGTQVADLGRFDPSEIEA